MLPFTSDANLPHYQNYISEFNSLGFSFLKFDRPFDVYSNSENEKVGICVGCGLFFYDNGKKKVRLKWRNNKISEMIAVAKKNNNL